MFQLMTRMRGLCEKEKARSSTSGSHTLPGGVEVTLWPAVETEFPAERDIGWWLVYRTPSWSVLVSLRDESDAETVAGSLSILAGTGLPVVRASGPLELAEGFGESEGARLAIADANPAPHLVSDLLGGTIFLSPDGCSGDVERRRHRRDLGVVELHVERHDGAARVQIEQPPHDLAQDVADPPPVPFQTTTSPKMIPPGDPHSIVLIALAKACRNPGLLSNERLILPSHSSFADSS
jgi:hypothetical protein